MQSNDVYKARILSLAVIGIAVGLWCVNFFGIEEYHRAVGRDFDCINGDDLARLEHSQLVRKVDHNTSRPEEFAPRVLRWRHHILIAHIETTSVTTTTHDTSTRHTHVVRLLQNATNLQVPHLRDVLRTGRSVRWRTLRTFGIVNATEMVGPVHLAETPDGSGVLVASAFVRHKHSNGENSRGFAVFVSLDENLEQWRSVIHNDNNDNSAITTSGSNTHRHRTLDIVNFSPPYSASSSTTSRGGAVIRASVIEAVTTTTTTITANQNHKQQLLLVQRFRSVNSLLSAAPYQCPSCIKSCGGDGADVDEKLRLNRTLTELTVRLPLSTATVVSATIVPSTITTTTTSSDTKGTSQQQRHHADDLMHVFVRSKDGSIIRVDVDLSVAKGVACPGDDGINNNNGGAFTALPGAVTTTTTTATAAATVPVVSITQPREHPFSDFRIMQFNSGKFSVKTPNFSLFLSASHHTTFNTLHTSIENAHKLQVVKLAWAYADGGGDGSVATTASAFALCSPILMHLGSIRGLHTTQISEKTVLAVYIREFRDVSSLHLANIYVGDAHAVH